MKNWTKTLFRWRRLERMTQGETRYFSASMRLIFFYSRWRCNTAMGLFVAVFSWQIAECHLSLVGNDENFVSRFTGEERGLVMYFPFHFFRSTSFYLTVNIDTFIACIVSKYNFYIYLCIASKYEFYIYPKIPFSKLGYVIK